MYPEDRVLVGVINRKVDFAAARDEGWYRIPVNRAPDYIDCEYVAFYFSRAFTSLNGGIHYYARTLGHELVRRRDLLPQETRHPRADDLYYRFALGPLQEKKPPILNPTVRPISFIFSTWDRFVAASKIADLYSDAEFFVARVSKVLNSQGVEVGPLWQDGELRARITRLRKEIEALAAQFPDSDDTPTPESIAKGRDALAGLELPLIPPEGS